MVKLINVVVVSVLAAVTVRMAAAQTVHVVGDRMGWDIPSSGGAEAYVNWAASRRFVVGDVLSFNFATNAHDVLQVTKASFDACTSTNPVGGVITVGPANVSLTSTGDHHFICTIGRHCQAGQKLSVTVLGSSAGGPSQPPATGGGATPSNPESPEDCPPEPAATKGPTGSATGSTSSMVVASFIVSAASVIMGLVF